MIPLRFPLRKLHSVRVFLVLVETLEELYVRGAYNDWGGGKNFLELHLQTFVGLARSNSVRGRGFDEVVIVGIVKFHARVIHRFA